MADRISLIVSSSASTALLTRRPGSDSPSSAAADSSAVIVRTNRWTAALAALVAGGGAFVLLVLSILISFAFASLGVLLALRFGTGEAVQGVFPLLFVTLFLSSSSLPRNLIKASWFRDVATYNPISYLVEAPRSLLVEGGHALPEVSNIIG